MVMKLLAFINFGHSVARWTMKMNLTSTRVFFRFFFFLIFGFRAPISVWWNKIEFSMGKMVNSSSVFYFSSTEFSFRLLFGHRCLLYDSFRLRLTSPNVRIVRQAKLSLLIYLSLWIYWSKVLRLFNVSFHWWIHSISDQQSMNCCWKLFHL